MTTILVIEDNSMVLENTVQILTFEGYDVIAATDGLAGLEIIRSQPIDLVICDIMMPQMNGYQVLETVRADASTAKLPFIFASAKKSKVDIQQGYSLGVDAFLPKPFTIEQLIDAVKQVV